MPMVRLNGAALGKQGAFAFGPNEFSDVGPPRPGTIASQHRKQSCSSISQCRHPSAELCRALEGRLLAQSLHECANC